MIGLTDTLSTLQAFGQKLGLAGPPAGAPDPRRTNAPPSDSAEDDLEAHEAAPEAEDAAVADSGPRPLAATASAPTTVYGFRANLKPVKAPDEILGRRLDMRV